MGLAFGCGLGLVGRWLGAVWFVKKVSPQDAVECARTVLHNRGPVLWDFQEGAQFAEFGVAEVQHFIGGQAA